MRIVGIVQARVKSTRLPEKVLADIGGVPMLGRVIERARRAGCLDDLWVATSDSADDDPIAAFAEEAGVGLYRGHATDVLARYIAAAEAAGADVIVRLTGDNPVLEPAYVRMTLDFHAATGADLTCSKDLDQIIQGTGCDVVSLSALRVAAEEGHTPDDREHVVFYHLRNQQRFKVMFLPAPAGWKNPGIRLTVDEQPDLDLVRELYARLAPGNPAFGIPEILQLFAREPELFQRNRGLRSRSKYEPSGWVQGA
jgi:spore coat polysaccharide biosynthesis protein SpsF